jgi:hypothetical protein
VGAFSREFRSLSVCLTGMASLDASKNAIALQKRVVSGGGRSAFTSAKNVTCTKREPQLCRSASSCSDQGVCCQISRSSTEAVRTTITAQPTPTITQLDIGIGGSSGRMAAPSPMAVIRRARTSIVFCTRGFSAVAGNGSDTNSHFSPHHYDTRHEVVYLRFRKGPY